MYFGNDLSLSCCCWGYTVSELSEAWHQNCKGGSSTHHAIAAEYKCVASKDCGSATDKTDALKLCVGHVNHVNVPSALVQSGTNSVVQATNEWLNA